MRIFLFERRGGTVTPYDMLPGGESSDKLRLLSPAVGPHARWRAAEDETASAGNTLSIQACTEAGVDESMSDCWLRGI